MFVIIFLHSYIPYFPFPLGNFSPLDGLWPSVVFGNYSVYRAKYGSNFGLIVQCRLNPPNPYAQCNDKYPRKYPTKMILRVGKIILRGGKIIRSVWRASHTRVTRGKTQNTHADTKFQPFYTQSNIFRHFSACGTRVKRCEYYFHNPQYYFLGLIL